MDRRENSFFRETPEPQPRSDIRKTTHDLMRDAIAAHGFTEQQLADACVRRSMIKDVEFHRRAIRQLLDGGPCAMMICEAIIALTIENARRDRDCRHGGAK